MHRSELSNAPHNRDFKQYLTGPGLGGLFVLLIVLVLQSTASYFYFSAVLRDRLASHVDQHGRIYAQVLSRVIISDIGIHREIPLIIAEIDAQTELSANTYITGTDCSGSTSSSPNAIELANEFRELRPTSGQEPAVEIDNIGPTLTIQSASDPTVYYSYPYIPCVADDLEQPAGNQTSSASPERADHRSLIIKTDFANFLASERSMLLRMVVIQLTIIAIVLATVGYCYHHLQRRKRIALKDGMQSFSLEDTSYRYPDNALGGIDDTGRAFNAMADRLQHQLTKTKNSNYRLSLIEQIFQTSPNGLVVLSSDFIVIDVNKTFVDMNGYGLEEIVGKPFDFLTHDISDENRLSMFEEAASRGRSNREFWVRAANGNRFRKKITLMPIRDSDQQITNYCSIERNVTEDYFNKVQLKTIASTDPLTGLRNRRQFELDAQLLELGEKGCYGLAIIDLDGLKEINSKHGHLAGDQIIEVIAKRLTSYLDDKTSSTYRLGGDEFCVILNNPKDHDELERVCQSIRSSIEGTLSTAHITTDLTVGMGASLFDPDRHRQLQDLLRESDIALKEAKAQGRSSFFLASTETLSARERHTNLSLALKSPDLESQIQIAYLPKVDIQNNILSGAEALIRWMSPDFGFIHNEEFMPIAEETGDILKIDDWVMHRATSDAALFSKIINGFQTTINLSPRRLFRSDFAQRLIQRLELNQVDTENFSIEITEWTAIQQYDQFASVIDSLRSAGISVELDDFGTGHSSLVNLHKLPVDALKIDRGFVRTMKENAVSLEIVRSVITLSRSLNMTVIAEGVENVAQLDILRDMGCEYCQGYLYSEPVIIESEASLLAAVEQWQASVTALS